MQITLSVEEQKKLEGLVSTGNFASVDEAVHAAIASIDQHLDTAFEEDPEWSEYAQDRIEAGWADMQAGRTKPAEEVMTMLRALNQE